MPTPAVSYRRISGAPIQVRTGHSLDEDQPLVINRLAAGHGLEVVAEFTDIKSGGSHARPGFLAMIDYIEEHSIGALVVAWTDRITRSQSAQERGALQDLLTRHKVMVYAGDGVYDLAQSSSILTWDVTTAVAAHRLREISQLQRTSRRRSAESGIWRASWPPLGYRRVYRSREAVEQTRITCDLVEDDTVGPLVREAFERYAAGAGVVELAHWWNAEGYPTTRGGQMLPHTLLYILRNPIYHGVLVHDRDGERIVREAVNVDPLLPTALWEAVNRRLAAESTIRPKSRRTECLYAGLLVCGSCGSRLWRISGRKANAVSDPVFYRCRLAQYSGGCAELSVREETITRALLPHLAQRLSPEWRRTREQETSVRVDTARRRLSVLDEQLQILTDLALRHAENPLQGITPDEYDARALRLREEQQQLRAELQATSSPEPELPARDRRRLLRSLTRPELRRLVVQTVSQITITDRGPTMPPIWR